MNDDAFPPPQAQQSPVSPPPPPGSGSVTPTGAASQGPVGEVRAYEPGAVKSEGGGCLSKGVVGLVIVVVVAFLVAVVGGGWWLYHKAKDTVDEVQDAVAEALVHPDCALLVDGATVPSEFVVNGSLDLSCGTGADTSLGLVLRCVTSGREYAQNGRGYAFTDDLIYHDGLNPPC